MSTPSTALPARTRPAPQPRPERTRDHLRVAPDPRRRTRARLTMFGVALVVIATVFALVAIHVFAAQSAFRLDELSKDRTNQQLRYERLREEVARLSAPEAVIDGARKLGMVPGQAQKYIEAPRAAPRGGTSDTPPASQSLSTYGLTKQHLDQNP
ncbi:MAG TPA: hypothetical protein VL856_07380 [Acidimicrobiia bacterium]|nr:hypothetical protein [Acidimicrobiia bacterium]